MRSEYDFSKATPLHRPPLWYNKQGTPISMEEANALLGDFTYKHVAHTRLWHGARVSTVWLGLDHAFTRGNPILFETMVFPASGFGELDCARYHTEAEARVGHVRMVREWRWRFWKVWAAGIRNVGRAQHP